MKKPIPVTLLISVVFLALAACKPDPGPGGKAGIAGKVVHHDDPIPNAIVYIRYDATEFPGEDAVNYHASTSADADGKYEFKNMHKGNYFLYGVGFDSSINETVKGGIPITINKKNEELKTDIPVTED